MKKKVTFEKNIEFPTMIGEISAVSLEPDLVFVDNSNVEGNLLLTGRYKLTEASRLEDDFSYKIPVEIHLLEKIDSSTGHIEIADFTYELDDCFMICHIELLVEGLELVEDVLENEKEEVRECDGEIKNEEDKEIPILEKNETEIIEEKEMENEMETVITEEEIEMEKEEKEDSEESLFGTLKDDQDTYGTYIVYIVRGNETLSSIVEKYHTTVEEIEKYNKVGDLSNGMKLIIPYSNE